MPYSAVAFFSVLTFALVHLYAEKIRQFDLRAHNKFLSMGGGIALAYIFVDLLPKLSENDERVKRFFLQIFPYFERHVYIMALIGFLLFFSVDRSKTLFKNKLAFFWLSLGSYALFNFLIGYAVVDKENPEVQPLLLFTIAIGLHYFTIDYSLCEDHGDDYRYFGKWILITSLFLGWIIGMWMELSETAIALVSAFIGGGVIMNVTRHELPERSPRKSLSAFLFAALIYTIILLTVGNKG